MGRTPAEVLADPDLAFNVTVYRAARRFKRMTVQLADEGLSQLLGLLLDE